MAGAAARRAACACVALSAVLTLPGCATIVNGKEQTIHIETEPPGAQLTILPIGERYRSPADVELKRLYVYTVRAEYPGYETTYGYIDRVGSGWVNGNLLIGGLIGMEIDMSSGGGFALQPSRLVLELERLQAPDEGPAEDPQELGSTGSAEAIDRSEGEGRGDAVGDRRPQ